MMEAPKDIQSLLLREQWETSFFEIVEHYSERLYQCAFGILGNHDDANDAVQEAFISIWKNLHKFEGKSSIFSWCYAIVRNQSLSELRKRGNRYVEDVEAQVDLKDDTSIRWTAKEIENQLARALAMLPDKQRMVFELRYYQDMPYDAMAELTHTSVGALKASYHHAKKKIGYQLTQALNLP
ncbi:MAG TPA: RNA polymerase subunit sigma [Cryomorphaceae bacterium]|nr:RNA polymerase subunit sigma [Cryomorphaceae bacterium]